MSINKTQYEQLCNDVRHYDTQLYVIPATLLLILGTSLKFAVERQDDIIKLGIIGFTIIICHTFTVLYAKLSIHQRSVRSSLSDIEINDPNLSKVGRTTSGPGDIIRIDRMVYKKNSPLWRYFFRSADQSILRMMMFSIFGTFLYFLKIVFD